jgi:hypothetical protein
MWFQKYFQKIFKRNSICNKCNSPSNGKPLCEKCQEYVDYVNMKNEEEAKNKEELKRRSWVKIRDDFLNSKNG